MISQEKFEHINELFLLFKKCSAIEIDSLKVKVHKYLPTIKDLKYFLDILEIPFTTFPGNHTVPEEIAIVFHRSTPVRGVLLMNQLISKVYPELNYKVYIKYTFGRPDDVNSISIGRDFPSEEFLANISRTIKPLELLKLNLEDVDESSFFKEYCNQYYDESGGLIVMQNWQINEMMKENGELENEDYYEDDDYAQWAQDDFEDEMRMNGLDPDIELDRSRGLLFG